MQNEGLKRSFERLLDKHSIIAAAAAAATTTTTTAVVIAVAIVAVAIAIKSAIIT